MWSQENVVAPTTMDCIPTMVRNGVPSIVAKIWQAACIAAQIFKTEHTSETSIIIAQLGGASLIICEYSKMFSDLVERVWQANV